MRLVRRTRGQEATGSASVLHLAQNLGALRQSPAARTLHGQSATEYLVLLAVVLVVGLVSVALLGFFPGIGGDAKKTQSDAYWKAARPFGILESSDDGNSLKIVMQNNEADTRTLQTVSIGGSDSSVGAQFDPGQKIAVDFGASFCTQTGAAYSNYVNFTYSTQHSSGQVQMGEKPIVGKCSGGSDEGCYPKGEKCTATSECCSGLGCGDGSCTCLESMGDCSGEIPCCSGFTCNDKLQCECKAGGEDCSAIGCCSGLFCDTKDYTCKCTGDGEDCSVIGCCGGYACVANKCTPE